MDAHNVLWGCALQDSVSIYGILLREQFLHTALIICHRRFHLDLVVVVVLLVVVVVVVVLMVVVLVVVVVLPVVVVAGRGTGGPQGCGKKSLIG